MGKKRKPRSTPSGNDGATGSPKSLALRFERTALLMSLTLGCLVGGVVTFAVSRFALSNPDPSDRSHRSAAQSPATLQSLLAMTPQQLGEVDVVVGTKKVTSTFISGCHL